MNGNWRHILRMELSLVLRDRQAVIWSLIAPLAMAWVFGSMFQNKPPAPTSARITAGDNAPWVGALFTDMLARRGVAVADSGHGIAIVLPDSLPAKLAAGAALDIPVYRNGVDALRANQVAARVREVTYTLAFQLPLGWADTPPSDDELRALAASVGPLFLQTRPLGNAPRDVSGKVHQLPAMLVMFLMFQLMTFFTVQWVADLRTGKIQRIAMSPTPIRDLFVAQLMSRLLWGLLQVAVILGVGSVLLGVRLDVPRVNFAVMLAAYMATAISLGLLVGTFFRTPEKANSVGVIIALVLAALGGCWWPLEIVSAPMRAVAMVLPTGIMMDAIGEMLAIGPTAPLPALNLTLLLAMTVVMMPIAVRRMRRQIVN